MWFEFVYITNVSKSVEIFALRAVTFFLLIFYVPFLFLQYQLSRFGITLQYYSYFRATTKLLRLRDLLAPGLAFGSSNARIFPRRRPSLATEPWNPKPQPRQWVTGGMANPNFLARFCEPNIPTWKFRFFHYFKKVWKCRAFIEQ